AEGRAAAPPGRSWPTGAAPARSQLTAAGPLRVAAWQASQRGEEVSVQHRIGGDNQSIGKAGIGLVVPEWASRQVARRPAGLSHDEIDRRDVPFPGLEGRPGRQTDHRVDRGMRGQEAARTETELV